MENGHNSKILLTFPMTVVSHTTKEVADDTKPDVYTVTMKSNEGELQIGKQEATATLVLIGIDDTLLRDFPNKWQVVVEIKSMFKAEPAHKPQSRPTSLDATFASGVSAEDVTAPAPCDDSKLFDKEEGTSAVEAEKMGKTLEEAAGAEAAKAEAEEPVKTKAKDRKNKKLAKEVEKKEEQEKTESEKVVDSFDLGADAPTVAETVEEPENWK